MANKAPVQGSHKLSVLYLMTEASYLSDLRDAINLAAAEKEIQLELSFVEFDFGQTPGIDTRDSPFQTQQLQDVISGKYDAMLIAPPFQSFSRSAFSRRGGRTPCRDLTWPRGFPWLEGDNKILVAFENAIIEFAVRLILQAAHAQRLEPWRRTRIWLEHPEDRGASSLGSPASIWQLSAMRQLASRTMIRGAFYRCTFDAASRSAPTGTLSDIPDWNLCDGIEKGWPFFVSKVCSGRAVKRLYGGPLSAKCGHVSHTRVPPLPEGTAAHGLSRVLGRAVLKDFKLRLEDIPTDGGIDPSHRSSESSLHWWSWAAEPPSKNRPAAQQQSAHCAPAAGAADPLPQLQTQTTTPAPRPKTDQPSWGSGRQASKPWWSWTAEKETLPPSCPASEPVSLVPEVSLAVSPTVLLPSAREIAAEASRRAAPMPIQDPDTDPDDDAAPAGAGWRGVGAPLSVGRAAKKRPFIDGGGLCSPGLWPPALRRLPVGTPCQCRELLLSALKSLEDHDPGHNKRLLSALAQGRVTEDPFPAAMLEDLRKDMAGLLKKQFPDMHVVEQPEDRPQLVKVRLLGAFLRAADDPDWKGMQHYFEGIHYGVGERLPRTPAVFPKKVKWRLPSQQESRSSDDLAESWDLYQGSINENYSSATVHPEALEKMLQDKVKEKKAFTLPLAEAQRLYGDKLTVASLGALVKSTSAEDEVTLRLLFDGTHGVQVNTNIHVRDQQQTPGAPDLRLMLRHMAEEKKPYYGLTFDVEGAHENVPVHERDWPLQAVRGQDPDLLYFSMYALFGVASISYWWGRLAAGVSRAMHYILGQAFALWMLLYADDYKLSASGPGFAQALLLALLTARVFGLPISWMKCSGGFIFPWVGLEINLRECKLGISEKRAQWLEGWYSATLDHGIILIRDLREALGRMSFVYGALTSDRPFLGPLYTWVAVSNPSGVLELPVFVRLILQWLRGRLRIRRSASCVARTGPRSESFRIDAKAEGNSICIRGWEPNVDANQKPSTAKARWFSIELTPETAPWAYCKGEPYKIISALELLASTTAVLVFGPSAALPADGQGIATVTGHTDSMVSTHAVVRGLSTSFPLCVVAMELAAQLEERSSELHLQWAPRTHNQEADDLSNSLTGGFDPAQEIKLKDVNDLPWLILPEFMRHGQDFYDSMKKAKDEEKVWGTKGRQPRSYKRPRHLRLRERDPW